MQTSRLVGIWKVESNAGKPPAEYGVKTALIQFKADGTFVDVIESLSPVPGLVPERVYRLQGAWKLDENTLERTVQGYWQNRKWAWPEESFAEGTPPILTVKEMVAINSDTLEIAAIQYDRDIEKEYIGIFVYKRVNTSQSITNRQIDQACSNAHAMDVPTDSPLWSPANKTSATFH